MSSRCEYDIVALTQTLTILDRRWGVDTNPLAMLHARPWLVKNKYLTCQLRHNGEDVFMKHV